MSKDAAVCRCGHAHTWISGETYSGNGPTCDRYLECLCVAYVPADESQPDPAEAAWQEWNAKPENGWRDEGHRHRVFLAGWEAAVDYMEWAHP